MPRAGRPRTSHPEPPPGAYSCRVAPIRVVYRKYDGSLHWVTTVPRWVSGDHVEMVYLDLDEFAEHQVRYGYPPEVISDAERTASTLLAAGRQRRATPGE